MHWLQKFAESYSGSGDIDQHNVADGSETSDLAVQNPVNNGGVYMDNEYQQATMPAALDAHQSIYDMADRDKPDPSRSDEYSDQPFGEQMVDDNHANNVATASLEKEADVAGAEANFLHEAPDSPKTMHDGHPLEELENNQQGINYVVNTDAPHADGPAGNMILSDPSIVDKVRSLNQTPDINKGRTAFVTSLNPLARSAREIDPNAPRDAWVGGGGSNVEDVMYPTEVGIKRDRSHMDFGSIDESGDSSTMSSSPNKGYSGDEYENSLYSGIQPSASDIPLKDYLTKIGSLLGKKAVSVAYSEVLQRMFDPARANEDQSRYYLPCRACGKQDRIFYGAWLCGDCTFSKRSDYVTPSANPHSGHDDQPLDSGPLPAPPVAMTDGKMTQDLEDGLMGDQDPTNNVMRRKRNKVQDDDAERYYNYQNTGGGFGGEGSGDFSGIQPSD